jgi:hypothetical protein
VAPETGSDPSASPEQRAIDAHTTRTLRKLIDELSPLRQSLLQMLFTDNPRSYAEVARTTGIPVGGIGPTRARALRQLRDKLAGHTDHEQTPRTTTSQSPDSRTQHENRRRRVCGLAIRQTRAKLMAGEHCVALEGKSQRRGGDCCHRLSAVTEAKNHRRWLSDHVMR